MAKGIYIGGADNLAHKVKKIYIGGADGLAHKVKKIYIGDANGKARLVWGGQSFTETTFLVTTLDEYWTCESYASNGEHFVVGGGKNNTTFRSYGDAFDKNLNHSTLYGIGPRYNGMGATNGNHLIFAGGVYQTNPTYQKVTTSVAYDKTLTRTELSDTHLAWDGKGIEFNGCAVFTGGWAYSNSRSGFGAYVNKELVLNKTSSLGSNVGCGLGVVGDYMITVGGYSGSVASSANYVTSAYAYSTSYVKSTIASISVAGVVPASASTPNYALFCGVGTVYSANRSTVVDAYSKTLVKTLASPTNAIASSRSGISTGEYAVFAHGDSSASKTVEVYNDNLTKEPSTDMYTSGYARGIGIVGDYLITAGCSSIYITGKQVDAKKIK